MKKAIALLSVFILTIISCSCHTNRETVTIWHLTDIHFVSPDLVKDEPYFIDIMERGDGKAVDYVSEVLDSFVSLALEEHPDAILISGDITLNGARISHEDFLTMVSPLIKARIPLLVLSGNHDLNCAAYEFSSEGPISIDGISPDDFQSLYSNLDNNSILSFSPDSFSFRADFGNNIALFCLDSNSFIKGSLSDETLNWLDNELKSAARSHLTPVVVSHQNLFVHHSMFTFGYQLNNADSLLEIEKKYHVSLHLSGHLHHQHIVSRDGITEIALSSFAVTPHHYGILTANESGQLSYNTHSVTGGFSSDTQNRFDICSSYKFGNSISQLSLSDSEKQTLLEYAVRRNREFFEGSISTFDGSALNSLLQDSSVRLYYYFSEIDSWAGIDFNSWTSTK